MYGLAVFRRQVLNAPNLYKELGRFNYTDPMTSTLHPITFINRKNLADKIVILHASFIGHVSCHFLFIAVCILLLQSSLQKIIDMNHENTCTL